MNSLAEPTGTLATALQHTARLLSSDPRMAVEQAGEILKVVPAHPKATLLLGVALRAAGEPLRSLEVLQSLLAAHADWPAVHYELGITLGGLDRLEDALLEFRRTVALNPGMPDAWREIGDLLTLRGDSQGADQAYARHIQASTQDPRLMAAANALCENQIGRAELMLREHLKAHPTDVVAIRMFAEVAGRLRRYADAEKLLVRCLELAPSFNAARYNYAMALYRQNKPRAALEQIDRLTASEPRNSGYRNLRAVVLANIGEYHEALEIYADVLAKHPEQSRIWMSYGHALAAAGRQADSIAAYRRCISTTPTLGEAYYSLANLKTFRFSLDELRTMQDKLLDPGLTEEDRAHFHFAIGKALEDSGNFGESFEHYAKANQLRLARVAWDPKEASLVVARSKELFTREFLAARVDSGAQASDPIFIVGLPRSGSTLIEQILASHSAVEGTMELPNIMAMAARLGGARGLEESRYPKVLADMSAADYRLLGEQYLEETRIQRKTGKPFFIDKMPNNFLHVGLIRLILPRAKIIDARRHPMACCFSAYKQNFAQGQRYSYSLAHLAQYYRDYVDLMAHFDQVDPGAVHRVVYEAMVDDTEQEIRRLLQFCGLEFEPNCLNFHENDRAVRTASSQQVRQPIYREGLEQWRNFSAWLAPLSDALGSTLTSYPKAP